MCKKKVVCLAFVCMLTAASVASAELVGWWTLDEDSGTVAGDSSGKGNHGTWEGNPTVVDGPFGNALAFANNRVAIPASDSLTADLFQGPFTLAAWINPTRAGNTWQQIFRAIRTDGGSNDTLFINNDGRLSWRGRVGGAWAGGMCETAAGVVPANDWTHVAVVGDGTNFRIYVNRIVSQQSAFRKTDGMNATYYVGGNPGATTESYAGMVDEVRVYNSALTDTEIRQVAARPKAHDPNPADGAIAVMQPLLQWTPGTSAMFHTVYFGTSPELTEANLVAMRQPFALYFHAAGLQPGVTYYWRVDEIEADLTTIHTGDVWSFTATPMTAFVPSPADGATNLFPAPKLTWLAGQLAAQHQVYFSNKLADVVDGAAAADMGKVTETTFSPGALRSSTTYYWRVDEIQANGTVSQGQVWSFTTADGVANKIVRQWWTGITGTAISDLTGHANYPSNPTGTELLDTFEGPVDWANNYGSRLYGWLTPPQSGAYTFTIASDDYSELRLSTDANPANATRVANVPGWTTSRQWDKYPEQKSAPITLQAGQKYFIEAVMKEGTGGDNIAVSWEGPGITGQEIISAAYVDTFGLAPLQAFAPQPADGAVDVIQAPVLSWGAGDKAVQHDVYLSDDAALVAAADVSSPLYQGRQTGTTFDAGELEWGQTYYWRVDEINPAEADSPWFGRVWSFTTADFIPVEDFEGYTDDEGNRIYETWIDGWTNGTGSTVGNLVAPFAEQTIIHGGKQSMPLDYNNTKAPFYSEAEYALAAPQNWTVENLSDLSLWFRGNAVTFIETAPGSITVSSTSGDVWTTVDHFRFVFKRLNGDGTIVARVDGMTDTAAWAKGGVMIRQGLDTGSPHAFMMLAPNGRPAFQNRIAQGEQSFSAHGNPGDVTFPHWIKLERKGVEFTGYTSADGVTWVKQTNVGGGTSPNPQMIGMLDPVYIGLMVTSNNLNVPCIVDFAEVTTTGNVTGQWQAANVGGDIPGNGVAPLYVAIEDAAGKSAVSVHPDPMAVTTTTWTEWKAPLADFAGVNLARVKKVYIGVGNRTAPVKDGAGRLYIDDIRVTK